MPSDVSRKIAVAYFDGAGNKMMIDGLAHILDKSGVGHAFKHAKYSAARHRQSCICAACIALRKAGML